MPRLAKLLWGAMLLSLLGAFAWGAPDPGAVLTVDAGAKGTPVSPLLYGAFFEDINYGADGGLYAEMIQNRSFEFQVGKDAWDLLTNGHRARFFVRDNRWLNSNNRNFAHLELTQPGQGISNEGYDGLVLDPRISYYFSVYLRSPDGSVDAVRVNLESDSGDILGDITINGVGRSWKKYTGVLKVSKKTTDGKLTLRVQRAGNLDVDMVSLFPSDTFKNRRNGLRADLAGMIGDLHPRFFRFPAGVLCKGIR